MDIRGSDRKKKKANKNLLINSHHTAVNCSPVIIVSLQLLVVKEEKKIQIAQHNTSYFIKTSQTMPHSSESD